MGHNGFVVGEMTVSQNWIHSQNSCPFYASKILTDENKFLKQFKKLMLTDNFKFRTISPHCDFVDVGEKVL